ncbi:MAG TPA: hypothetical protein VGF16_10645 [Bryobacteraceae bacterium]|jgi:hypothetical protein
MRTLYLGMMVVSVAHAVVLDRIAVVVGTDVITEGEIIEELRLDQFMASQPLDLGPQQRRATAARLVDQQLIRQEMEVTQYRPPEANEADAMLRTFRQHFRTEAEYRAGLEKYGVTEDDLKQHLLWQLTAIRFTDWRFGGIGQLAPEPSANREVPPGTPSPAKTPSQEPVQSADRAAPDGGGTNVDQQLDEWLKQARSTTKVAFKQEAFQ